MRILVIFTGGTIGSMVGEKYISPDGSRPYKLLDMYNTRYENDIQWDTECPYTILSENMTCKEYGMLLKCLKTKLKCGYDGIIITHGSDTLQYTAAALSFLLGSNTIPIMLVASNYVLEDERANGLENFRCAVDFITNEYGRGVFVPYANPGEGCTVHMGSRMMPHIPYSDCMHSLDNQYFGQYIDDNFVINDVCNTTGMKAVEEPEKYLEQSGIVYINVHPGMRYPVLDETVKAILINTYHSGTICMDSDSTREFFEQSEKYAIPVYITGQDIGTDYESCDEYEKYHIHILKKASPVVMYIKLWLAFSINCPQIMEVNIAGEFLNL